MWVPLMDAQQLLVQAPAHPMVSMSNTRVHNIILDDKGDYIPGPRCVAGSKLSGTSLHSGGRSEMEVGWVIRIRSNSWIKSTFNKYKKIFRNVFITSSSELSPISFQASNHLQEDVSITNWKCHIGTCIRNGGGTAI